MNDWFEWNGVNCADFKITVLTQPTIVTASERVSYQSIPGKPSSLTLKEGSNVYDDITLTCFCIIDTPYKLSTGAAGDLIAKISEWLSGDGEVTFAVRPDGFYKARVTNQVSFEQLVKGNLHRGFQIQFRCKPFFNLFTGLQTKTALPGSTSFTNLGNLPSKPLLKIVGTAEGTIMIGDQSVLVDSLSDVSYMMVDCEAMVAYRGTPGSSTDPMIPMGTRIKGDWLEIPTGSSFMSITSGITSVVVTPRWWVK
jgi:phage-related protein